VRRLLPSPTDVVDLDQAYAVPPASDGVHVRANMVASVDGAAVVDRGSAALSGPADRRVLSVLRGLADVILVGAETVRREDLGPVRPSAERTERRRRAGMSPVPPVAVVSGSLDLDPSSRFFAAAVAPPLVLTTAAAPGDRRTALAEVADVIVVGDQAVDLTAGVDMLAARGLRRVLCEGGPTLLGQLAAAHHLDELCLTLSPQLAGGGARSPILAGPPLPGLATLALEHLLEEDGFLFLRYAVAAR